MKPLSIWATFERKFVANKFPQSGHTGHNYASFLQKLHREHSPKGWEGSLNDWSPVELDSI